MSAASDPRLAWSQSFGARAERYERTRPRYPDALIRWIIDACPGPALLDVGCGTGIVARQLRAAGATVLGVEVDARMAQLARRHGIQVEEAPFQRWDRRGRTFDGVVAGQTWHWIEPRDGALAAARALRPGGRLAAFWNIGEPSSAQLTRAFANAYARLPGPLAQTWTVPPLQAYGNVFARTGDGIRAAGAFGEPRRWQSQWRWRYRRDDWLEQIPTFGGHDRLPGDALDRLLVEVGAAVDAAGGAFEMRYTTVAVTAARTGTAPVGDDRVNESR
jgi:SAM-dependent methyltransferase